MPSPTFTSMTSALGASAPGALGEPARAAACTPFASTSWPSFVGHPGSPALPQSFDGWTFGIDPAASGPVPAKCPCASSGFSQSVFGDGCAVFPGNGLPPAHGTVPVGSGGYVLVSLFGACLHTVVSPSTSVSVFPGFGITLCACSWCSAG